MIFRGDETVESLQEDLKRDQAKVAATQAAQADREAWLAEYGFRFDAERERRELERMQEETDDYYRERER